MRYIDASALLAFLMPETGAKRKAIYILKRIRMFFRLIWAFGCLCSCGAVAASPEMAVCDEFAKQAIVSETPNPARTTPPSRELCFPDGEPCVVGASLSAQEVWEHSPRPSQLKAELMEYRDWTGRVSEVAMPSMRGALVRISRLVGTAHCIRDTFLLRQDNRYQSIHSASLDQLSAEAGNCGDVAVRLKQFAGEPLLVTAFYGIVTAYRFAPNFDLREVCTIRYRAPWVAR